MSTADRALTSSNLFEIARQCLECCDPVTKCELTMLAVEALLARKLNLNGAADPIPIGKPGRPERPRLVAPRELPHRRVGSLQGKISLLHALAHIEFNAINLAWDAIYRFRDLPAGYYNDWARVAAEEAVHFGLLCERLNVFGAHYGELDAHDGLWEMAVKTAHDPLVRMALVPRVLEARGLDVTPGIIRKVQDTGDTETVDVLEIILRDEIGHVEIGTRWFRYLCNERGLEPDITFSELLKHYMKAQVKQPFHYKARQQAGFSEREMATLEQLAGGRK
jgi:uncharacterized ferritin-like protein (DUF455 family)